MLCSIDYKTRGFSMIKKIATVCIFVLLGNTVHAEISSSDTFVGVEIASTEVQGEQPSMTSDSVSFGLRVGAQNEEWRTIIGFNFYDKNEYSVEKLYLSVDYLFMNYDLLEDVTFQPYIGANFGYANYEQGAIDENGMTYGGQMGVIFHMMKRFDVDLGYRYMLSSADSFDHESNLFLGFHYYY